MKLINLYYNLKSGEIISYQGGDLPSPDNEIPEGCGRVVYPAALNLLHPQSHRIQFKIDPVTKLLIDISDQVA